MAASNKVWVDNSSPTCNDDDLNGFKNENNNLITSAGLSLDTGNNQQTTQAVSIYAAGGDYYTAAGTVDAITLAPVGTKLSPTSYFDGFRIRFIPTGINTGAVTVDVNTLGVQSLRNEVGAELVGGELSALRIFEAFYDGTNFRLTSSVVSNTVSLSFTTEIQTANLNNVDVVRATFFNSNRVALSGAEWGFTGTTIPGNSGAFDPANGHIYDVSGRQYEIRGAVLPQQYGAVADQVTDDAVLIQHAMRRSLWRLDGMYAVGSTLEIQNTTSGTCLTAEIHALTNDFDVFTAPTKRDFEILGGLRVIGPGGAGTGVGFHFTDATRYDMENIIVTGLQNGILLDGVVVVPGGLGGYRGRQGRWVNATVHNCNTGIAVIGRAEYTLWINPQSCQNDTLGFHQAAGNTIVIGGNINDNQNGILCDNDSTTNECHGMFISTNVNHNIGYNLRCENVDEGHTFNGCHFFGDSAVAGTIEIVGCGGIHIKNGLISSVITIDDTGATVGREWNVIANNQINPDHATLGNMIVNVGTGRERLVVRDNFTMSSDAWAFNDRALYSVVADTNGVNPAQSIPDSTVTTVIFDNELEDNRSQYDHTTGVYTANQAQFVQAQFSVSCSITGGTYVRGFAAIYVGGVCRAKFPFGVTNAATTSVSAGGALNVAVVSSTTIEVRILVDATAGTIEVADAVDCNFTVTGVGN